MKKFYFLVLCFLTLGFITRAQEVITFEDFELNAESFLNGSDLSGGFTAGDVFLPNAYDTNYESWVGWAISNVTDTQTAGFMNQYAPITGSGYDGSSNFAMANAFSNSKIIFQDESTATTVTGLYITSATYAYLSILNGDGFAKKFGGEDGNDPDFFLLTVNGYFDGELKAEQVEFYLADYRFEDNTMDYIVDEWTWLDLSPLGLVDSIEFSLTSTDNNDFGMLTPSYFAIDDLTTITEPVSTRDLMNTPISYTLFPNPVSNELMVNWQNDETVDLFIYNSIGKLIAKETIVPGQQTFDLSDLPSGNYAIKPEGQRASWMVKK